MRRKFIYYMGLLILILVAISACNSKPGEDYVEDTGTSELQADISELPDTLSRDSIRIINLSGRQQYRYQSIDGKERLVLEIRTQTSDIEDVNEVDTSVLYKPEIEEVVFEWTQDNMQCMVFGTFSEAELQEIAESVQVNIYE